MQGTCRNWQPQSDNPKELNSANTLNELGSRTFPSQVFKWECSLANTWVTALVRPWSREPAQQALPPDPQKCKLISMCYFKMLSLWCFIAQQYETGRGLPWPLDHQPPLVQGSCSPPAPSDPFFMLSLLSLGSGMLTSRAATTELSCPLGFDWLWNEAVMQEKAGEGELRLTPCQVVGCK